jgi:hypothetical protein
MFPGSVVDVVVIVKVLRGRVNGGVIGLECDANVGDLQKVECPLVQSEGLEKESTADNQLSVEGMTIAH